MYEIKIEESYMFEMGMLRGVENFALDINDANKALYYHMDSKTKKMEKDAFLQGYKLANQKKYMPAWKEERNLLMFSILSGDVKPVGWMFLYDRNNNCFYKQENKK